MKTRKTKSTILGMLLLIMLMQCVVSCNKPDNPNNGGNEGGDTPEPGEVIDGPDLMTFTVNGVSFDMIKVEGGTFWMGAQSENENGQNYDNEATDAESPVHQVALSDYYIGKYEVTQELWQAIMGTNPSHFQGELLPVENVGPNSIKDFLSTLNDKLSQEINGLQFRLPSEAQWEFAAKGGKEDRGNKYSGSNIPSIVAWYNQNANGQTHPVGAKEPNELFIYDMSGNVAEWCQDYMGGYVGVPQTDPVGPSHEFIEGMIGNIEGCIVRGGAWSTSAQYCRSTSRAGWLAGDSSIGFRLVLSRTEGHVSVPGVRIGEVSNITTNSACVRGSIVSDGGRYPTEWGFYYGTSPDLATNGTYKPLSEFGNSYSFSDTLVNLQVGTKYYVCAYAKNEKGIGYSDTQELATLESIHVVTPMIYNITDNSAVCEGTVISDGGGASVIERGVCWSTMHNPTINNGNHNSSGLGNGDFVVEMSDLMQGTIYYVRAYATNQHETYYGEEICFKTTIMGSIIGAFTIKENVQVYFSKGNLQYQASTNTWRFANNQYEYVGENNALISDNYNGWIDLFGWGTSGYNHGAICYQPWSTSDNDADYYAYGSPSFHLNNQTGQADWGYNSIINGGNTNNMWFTIDGYNLFYILWYRTTPSGIRFAKAKIHDVKGVIILPDNWDENLFVLNQPNDKNAEFDSNIISASVWTSIFEINGAVFLPVAGRRERTTINTNIGQYWLSYAKNDSLASTVWFTNSNMTSAFGSETLRHLGCGVRLVRLVQK